MNFTWLHFSFFYQSITTCFRTSSTKFPWLQWHLSRHCTTCIFSICPSYSFTLFPYTFSFNTSRWRKCSFSMLDTKWPISLILSFIWVRINSKSIFFIIYIGAFILSSIRPFISSFTMHIIIFPLAFINSSIIPFVYSKSIYFI